MKIIIKYQIEVNGEVIECETLDQAERRMRSLHVQEVEGYLIRREYKGDKLIEEYLME